MYLLKTELCKNENVRKLNSRAIVFDDRFYRIRFVFSKENGYVRMGKNDSITLRVKRIFLIRLKTDACGQT